MHMTGTETRYPKHQIAKMLQAGLAVLLLASFAVQPALSQSEAPSIPSAMPNWMTRQWMDRDISRI